MARVTDGLLDGVELGLGIDRYQELLRLPEAVFNGLNKPDDPTKYACETIWTQTARDDLAMFIAQAEEMRRQELGYYVVPQYVLNEEHPYGNPVALNWKHIVNVGVKTTSTILAGVVLDHGAEANPNDPVEISVATSVTNTGEIGVFYPGEDVEIRPFSISISGGTATIKIPRSRLVKPALNDDREDHLYYHENDNFLATVDVKRVYTDTGTGAYLVWTSVDLVIAGVKTYPDGTEDTQDALFRIADCRTSIVNLFPASAGAGAALKRYPLPSVVRVSYIAGRRTSMSTEMRTVRLAHTLTPNKPTKCEAVAQYWADDNKPHESAVTTPYGNKTGAVDCWLADSRAKVGMGGMLR